MTKRERQQHIADDRAAVRAALRRPRLKLIGEDSNAFAILGRALRAAKAAGWTNAQWAAVREEATRGDYMHLLATLEQHFNVF